MAKTSETPRIFVSYRRSESGTAGRIFDRLVAHFGEHNVFIDIDNIPFGVDFRQHIGEALRPGDLLLAIVGKNWLGPVGTGKNRIDDATDPVRVEIETALERDIAVLPVVVDDAKMPAAEELPDSIKAFAYRNAVEVESGRDFNFHVDRLIRSIDGMLAGRLDTVPSRKVTAKPPARGLRRIFRPRNLAMGFAGLAAVALLAAAFSEGARLSVESDSSTYAVEVSRSSRQQPTPDVALAAWNAVKDMDSAHALDAFISKFGDSFYADLAKAKLDDLRKKAEEAKMATAAPPMPVEASPSPIVWTSSTSRNPDMVGTEAIATDGVTGLDGGCNTQLEPGFHGILRDYSGDALDRTDDVSRPVIFAVKRRDGTSRSFSASMHYFEPDAAWVLSNPLPVAFLDELAAGHRLSLQNAQGTEVVEFELAGADKVRAAIRQVCGM